MVNVDSRFLSRFRLFTLDITQINHINTQFSFSFKQRERNIYCILFTFICIQTPSKTQYYRLNIIHTPWEKNRNVMWKNTKMCNNREIIQNTFIVLKWMSRHFQWPFHLFLSCFKYAFRIQVQAINRISFATHTNTLTWVILICFSFNATFNSVSIWNKSCYFERDSSCIQFDFFSMKNHNSRAQSFNVSSYLLCVCVFLLFSSQFSGHNLLMIITKLNNCVRRRRNKSNALAKAFIRLIVCHSIISLCVQVHLYIICHSHVYTVIRFFWLLLLLLLFLSNEFVLCGV